MAKCTICGEVNPASSSFCSQCGAEVAEKGISATQSAMEETKKQFERDALVSLDRSKITFVCELCGTINRIDSPRCVRCGKPRPRSEFVRALKKIKESGTAKEEENKVDELASTEEAKNDSNSEVENAQKEKKLSLYRYEPNPDFVKQNQSMVQPFVIVPYVDTMHKLWQYNPQQVYKYQPYTPEEKTDIQNRLNNAGDLLAIKQQELERQNTESLKADSLSNQKKKEKKVRINALLSLIFSLAIIGIIFFLPIFNINGYTGMEIIKSLGNAANGLFGTSVGFTSSYVVYDGWQFVLLPLITVLIILFSAILAILSMIRLFTGKARRKGLFLPIAILVLTLALIIVFLLDTGINNILLDSIHYSLYIILGSSILLTIVGALGGKNARRRK